MEIQKEKLKKIALVVFAVVSILVAAFFVYRKNFSKNVGQATNNTQVKPTGGQTTDPTAALGNLVNIRDKYSFPSYDYQKSDYKPNVPDYSINLTDIKNISDFEKPKDENPAMAPVTFSDSQKQALQSSNFFVAENKDNYFGNDPTAETSRTDDWTDLYGKIGGYGAPQYRAPENSVFVSSDFALHVYHKLLDKEFEYIEQTQFYPKLKKITDGMLSASIDGYNSASSDSEKGSYQRLIAYFAVPDAILTSSNDFYTNETIEDDKSDSKDAVLANLDAMKDKIPAQSYDLAKQEIGLVMDASALAQSPLFGPYQDEQALSFNEDYSQYGPRSHYGKNPVLRSYFRSMMWYGRQNFLIKSPELTQDAVNITAMMEKTGLTKEWEDIYVPTSFFVGESDDLGIYDYNKVISENKDIASSDAIVSKIQSDLADQKNPQIMSSSVSGVGVADSTKQELQDKTKGFHFMGQRFTPDAFVFSTLTQGDEKPDPKTGEKLPTMPTALMVMSTLGNSTADTHLNDWITQNAPQSKNVISDRIGSLKTYFDGLDQNWWSQNIYWGWIYTLRSLSQESLDKTGYPNFMKNDDWNNKNLQSSLGSWTELKHDTLLYAKQSYAEMGGGGPDGKIPPVPKGYVDPNIEFWDRLIPLAKMTEDGLNQRGLLDQEFQGRNDDLINSLEFFRKIAIAEVNNQTISDDDFERLRLESGRLSSVIRPLPSEQGTEDLARSAVIADVHTDGVNNEILYEADGKPNYIYVAVKDQNGTRLTKGLVYSYYEFKQPLQNRLTDTDWRGWVYGDDTSKVPSMPAWNKAMIK